MYYLNLHFFCCWWVMRSLLISLLLLTFIYSCIGCYQLSIMALHVLICLGLVIAMLFPHYSFVVFSVYISR